MRGTIQVDLDSLWTYRRYLGQPEDYSGADPVYSEGLEVFLDIFEKYSIKATFFIIGRDAQNSKHKKIIKQIISLGHEVANHTMTHPMNFANMDDQAIKKEIKNCHDVLEDLTKEKIKGFRAATFSVNERMLRIIQDLGYIYDSSVIPSLIVPIALNVAHSLLGKRFKNVAGNNLRFAYAPISFYKPAINNMVRCGSGNLYEVPISVIPGMRLPMHSSYVFVGGKWLFDLGLSSLKKRKIPMNYLFHGIDLLETRKYNLRLPFFGSLEKRRRICEYIVKKLKNNCDIMRTDKLLENNGRCR